MNESRNWVDCTIGEISKLSGGSAFKEKFQGHTSGEIPFIKVSDFNLSENQKYITRANNWVSSETLKEMGAKVFPPGSVVFPKVGAALLSNRRRILLRPTALDNNLMAAIPNGCCSEYLYHALCKVDFSRFVQEGAVPSINQEQVASVELSIPPLPEQKKIAEILSGIDVSICLQKNKAEKYQTVITSFRDNLVKQLLRKESTKILPLDNVSRVIDSLHTTPVFTETGIPMVRVTDIKTGVLSLENTKKVTSEAYKLYIKNHEPAEGDIVISRVGSYGITSLNTRNQKFCLGQNTALIHPTSIDGCFLYECLNSSFLRDQVEFMVEGSGYKSLSLASIRSLRIPVPSAIDQCELSSFLKSIQKSLAIEVEYGKKLAIAKNALSADLLSGRKRVSV